MQSKTIINLLSNETSHRFIETHLKDDVKKLALVAMKYEGIDVKAACSLISLYQKAKIKLPEHYKAKAAMTSKSYEQCTSEAVAKYKASVMDIKGKHIVNLSGGLGVDDWAMAEYASGIDSCELDLNIHEMAIYNATLFKNNATKRHLTDGLEFIRVHEKTDVIYVDPDRRSNETRVFRLEECEPDVLSNMHLLLNKANKLWVKISPMADITYLEKSIPYIKKILVIAWLGEVKEILICCEASTTDARHQMMKEIVAVNIGMDQTFTFSGSEMNGPIVFNNRGKFLFEPNRAIIKAGLSSHYCHHVNAQMLGQNSHLYVCNQSISNFQGRSFEVTERLAYKPKHVKQYLQANNIHEANITVRNLRETAVQLKERFRLKDGGIYYLFFTTDNSQQQWVFVCKALKPG